MIVASEVTAILLAAGRSSRFGSNKLHVEIDGVPIAERAASALRDVGFGRLIVVVGQDPLSLLGFEPVMVAPQLPMSASIAAGVQCARARPCRAVMIALADMPFVTCGHFEAMLAAHDRDITASVVSGRPMVPAIFDRAHFLTLELLQGDAGARVLLTDARLVSVSETEMLDIDEIADLNRFGGSSGPIDDRNVRVST